MLERGPIFWARTRARLDADALAKELGPSAVPVEPPDTSATAQEQVPPR